MVTWLHTLGSAARACLAVACLLLTSGGLGHVLVKRLRWTHAADAAIVAIVTGLNLAGLVILLAGVSGLLTPMTASVLLIAPAAVTAARLARRYLPRAAASLRAAPPLPLLSLAALALVTLGPALCYPGGWDELVYHITLPQRWLADMRPAVYTDLPYSAFPSLPQLLFWFMAPLDVIIAPRLLVWACWLLCLVALYRLARRLLPPVSSLVVTAAFGLGRTMLMVAADAYAEPLVVLNLAAILLSTRAKPRGNDAGSAPILGVLVGGAAAVKLTGAALAATPAIWFATRARHTHTRRVLARSAVAAGVAVCVALPFYCRPWLATGNPLYPYFAQWFGGAPTALAVSRFHHDIGSVRFGLQSIQALLSAPVLLAFHRDTYDGAFGWQFLVLIALAAVGIARALRRPSRRPLLIPAWTALALYLFWFFTSQQARFLAPAALALTLAAATGLRAITSRRARQALLGALCLATLLSMPVANSGYYFYSWSAVLGRTPLQDYVHTGTGGNYLTAVDVVYHTTPPNAHLLLLFEHRGLYIPRRHTIGTPYFQEQLLTPPGSQHDPESVQQTLERHGITHVLMAVAATGPDLLPRYVEQSQQLARSLAWLAKTGQLRTVWRTPEYVLWQVTPATAAAETVPERTRLP